MKIYIGQQIESYYGNGDFIGDKKIDRITEHSVFFVGGQRESINTVKVKFETGLYKTKSPV